jgi:hypothetical protein
MRIVVCFAALAVCVTGAHAQSFGDIHRYCAAVRNSDAEQTSKGCLRYSGPAVHIDNGSPFPSPWRCKNGTLYTCQIGASGRLCSNFSASRTPTKEMTETCAIAPGDDIPNAVNRTVYQWHCNGKTPVIDPSYQPLKLDAQGYIENMWEPVPR